MPVSPATAELHNRIDTLEKNARFHDKEAQSFQERATESADAADNCRALRDEYAAILAGRWTPVVAEPPHTATQ